MFRRDPHPLLSRLLGGLRPAEPAEPEPAEPMPPGPRTAPRPWNWWFDPDFDPAAFDPCGDTRPLKTPARRKRRRPTG